MNSYIYGGEERRGGRTDEHRWIKTRGRMVKTTNQLIFRPGLSDGTSDSGAQLEKVLLLGFGQNTSLSISRQSANFNPVP